MSQELAIPKSLIENRIHNIRGIQVMLDSDLAVLYQTETKYINRAVKRNPDRFPKNFVFQLNENEWENLRFQFGTLKTSRGQHKKYLPNVFSEQGVAMLSTVIQTPIAVKVSVQIMQAFVNARKFILNNASFLQRLDRIEFKQLETDQKFEKVFKALEAKDIIPAQGVFFNGQVFDAHKLISDIIKTSKNSIILIDNYIDESVLVHLGKKSKNVKAFILTKNITKQLSLDVQKANNQFGNIQIKEFTLSHDRFLIIDNETIYHLGASLKDLGKKWFAFSKLNKNSVQSIINSISELL